MQKSNKSRELSQKPPVQIRLDKFLKTKDVLKQSTQKDIKDKESNQILRKQSSIQNLSANTEQIPLYNIQFYSNKRQSDPHGDYIDTIHKDWWKNYKLLQKHHGFIQWIFPNSYKSRFNERAYPIAIQQIRYFIQDETIYKRYLKTYEMMLQFYGMTLKDKRTGQLKRSRSPAQKSYKKRYYETFITSYHNHMRITRILSSLTLLGFARFAKQLSLFLKYQIFNEQGQLKQLKKIRVYQRQWKQFEDIDLEDYQQSHYFKKFNPNN